MDLGLTGFTINEKSIKHVNGSEIIFIGLRMNPSSAKSMEGCDILFIEEAETISKTSWKTIIPTIRKIGSEIWVVFNPRDATDETYKRFVDRKPHSIRWAMINYDENPWFPITLELERQDSLRQIEEAVDDEERAQLQADYDHVWLGMCQALTMATIFRKRVSIHEFDDPDWSAAETRPRYGADWGFANDPTALVRFWITSHPNPVDTSIPIEELWISHEAFGWRVEIDEIPKLFDTVPGSRQWPIKADCARPETISYTARQGFAVTPAEKWPGSVEDGIAHVKGYRRIHVHKRCKHLQDEARLYQYKVDRITQEVLPVVVDKHNHGWDAIRYGLDGVIQRRGQLAQFMRLAG